MDPADDFAGDLSPDGKTLAFHSWRTGSRDIVVQPLDGAAVQVLTRTPGQESYPRWSPDGLAIAFVDQTGFQGEVVHGDLFVMRLDGSTWSAPRQIARGVATQGTWQTLADGDRLAFAREGSIVLIHPETGAAQVLYAPAPGSSDPLAWSVAADDNRTLYFKSGDRDGRTTIWALPAAGGAPRLLVRFTDPNRQSIRPDFAVGAGRIFFTIEDRQADIWVAEVSRR
jgi:dipeptidyl aminopeptidase/acylaminoacyl peptidase